MRNLPRLIVILYAAMNLSTEMVRAQVYSVNAVGYINVAIQPGVNLIGLQLDSANRTVASLFTDMPEGSTIQKIVDTAYTTNLYQNGQWERPDETLSVGEGVLVINPSVQAKVVTFVGAVLQGDLTNSIPAGLSIRCSLTPIAGKLTATLGLKLSAFDNVYLNTNNTLKVFTFLPDGHWQSFEPSVPVAGSFIINAEAATNWITHFELNL
ncbi:MAG: hypothetical protein JWM99_642 [Verrucomicrobiales bacterium]|jgi:hypothetical protein|nr:hypothetical protein [Verrucomicrobiales bacterium]